MVDIPWASFLVADLGCQVGNLPMTLSRASIGPENFMLEGLELLGRGVPVQDLCLEDQIFIYERSTHSY